MPRKRKRNAGLAVVKKSCRRIYSKSIDNSNDINIDNMNILNDNATKNSSNDNDNTSNSNHCSSNNSNVINVNNNSEDADITTTLNLYDELDDMSKEDAPIVVQDFNLEMKVLRQMKVHSHRWSIFNLFVFKYNGLNPPNEDIELYKYWIRRAGIASKIKRDLRLPRTYCVKDRMVPIFEKILDCFKVGEKFCPSLVDNRGGNRPMTIKMNSSEAQIIADGMESGLSIKRVWENTNRHRRENDDELVSEAAIYYAVRKMKPKIVNMTKCKQGSSDPNSNWAQARRAWAQQLLARLGKLVREPKHGPLEKRFDGDIQGKLALDQIVWWDETHRKCLIGGQNPSKSIQMLFPRNKEGRIDIEKGEYSQERKTILNVKYEKECRLGLGVAMVTPLDPDGTTLPAEGRRCHPYDYSSKMMISVNDYKRMTKLEFDRVKSLKCRNGYWISSNRDQNIKYYSNDPVIMLKGVGKKASQQLKEIGITTIGEVKNIEDPSKLDNLPNGFKKNLLYLLMKLNKLQVKMPQRESITGSAQTHINPSLEMIGSGTYLLRQPFLTLHPFVATLNT